MTTILNFNHPLEEFEKQQITVELGPFTEYNVVISLDPTQSLHGQIKAVVDGLPKNLVPTHVIPPESSTAYLIRDYISLPIIWLAGGLCRVEYVLDFIFYTADDLVSLGHFKHVQLVSMIAKRYEWRRRQIGRSYVYAKEDVDKYLRAQIRSKLARQVGRHMGRHLLWDVGYDITCPKCAGFAVQGEQQWICEYNHKGKVSREEHGG